MHSLSKLGHKPCVSSSYTVSLKMNVQVEIDNSLKRASK